MAVKNPTMRLHEASLELEPGDVQRSVLAKLPQLAPNEFNLAVKL